MIECMGRCRTHHGLGPPCDRNAGLLQHRQVVRAIADCQRLRAAQAQRAAQFHQPVGFRARIDDRAADPAGELARVDFKHIGQRVVE